VSTALPNFELGYNANASLAAKKYSDITCERPIVDNSREVIVATPTFGVLAVVFFLLRVLSRYLSGWQSCGLDDWIMLVVVVSQPPLCYPRSI
jgi:hypothetical protein